MMNPNELNNKIKKYEYFLENTLKSDLRDLEITLNKTIEDYTEWEQILQVLKVVREHKEKDIDLDVLINIGQGIRVQGEIIEYERMFIDIGLGYLLEMDYDEAEKYTNIRLRSLKKCIDHYRDLAVKIKVNIKLLLLAINELQSTLVNK